MKTDESAASLARRSGAALFRQRTRARGGSIRALSRRYGIALLSVATALASTLFLQNSFPYPFLFLFFAAVMASSWFGGMGPGLFAVLLSTISVDYFFVRPYYSLAINTTDATYFAAFIVCSSVASWVSSSKKQDQEALRENRDQLEIRVTERTVELEKSNSETRERERQLRLLTEVIPQQIWSGMPDGSIEYCNQRLLDYAGCTMEEMRGERFLEIIHPEDRNSFRHSWNQALSMGLPFEGEWRVFGADGSYRWFFTRGVPLLDAAGSTVRWYGTNTDIEERKTTEEALRCTRAELACLSRVLTMGELTASIAHEVNQPLTAVVTFANACLEWLSAEPPNLDEARQTAEKAVKEGTRAGAVLTRIRALFQKEPPSTSWLDMNEVIQDLTAFLRDEAMRHRISLHADLSPDLTKVKGDRVQLQQVVLNLIMNAIEATSGASAPQKEIVIRSRNEGLEGSDGIRILVEDCGAGVTPEMIDQIFHPFFSTKARGTGMGLSISRSIVESHQGRLWAIPRRDGGSIFQFIIPLGSQNGDGV